MLNLFCLLVIETALFELLFSFLNSTGNEESQIRAVCNVHIVRPVVVLMSCV